MIPVCDREPVPDLHRIHRAGCRIHESADFEKSGRDVTVYLQMNE